jgi:AGCS family alanine or glycine:cation symporter
MLQTVQTINAYLSDYVLVFLLVAVGLWYTVKTRCVQVRCLWEGLKGTFGGLSLSGGRHDGGMSSFQALATAIAAQVGTGAIVGCSGAILIGGPGAIFWMWVIAFFGMATIYAEATLAQQTRVTDLYGNLQGGPVYYITTAFKGMLRKIRGRRANLEAVVKRHTHKVEGGRHFKRRERNKSPAKSGYHH